MMKLETTPGKSALVKFASACLLLIAAYVPAIIWMVERWNAADGYYGHGYLIPLVSAFIIWQRKDVLRKIKPEADYIGISVVAFALFINVICAALKIYFISGFSFVIALYGLVLFFFGRDMARNLIFPIFFLMVMVPLPLVVVGNLTVKMKLFAAQCATFTLNKIGFPSVLDGSIIRMPNSFIAVEAPCSGLRSLIALLTLGLLFTYMLKASNLKKGVLLASSVPIALGTNVLRIVMLATVNDLYGGKIAMGFFHDASGFVVFGIAFIALLGVSKMLEKGAK